MKNVISKYTNGNLLGKWLFKPSPNNFLIILIGTILNLLGSLVADTLSLPLFLDCIGTFQTAIILGPIAGAISGGLVNVIISIWDPSQLMFFIVNVAGGIIVGRFFPRNNKKESFAVIATSLLAGFIMSVIATPLNMIINDGFVGNEWGDALVEMLSASINVSLVRCTLGSLFVNMPDKALSIILVILALHVMSHVFWHKKSSDNDPDNDIPKDDSVNGIKKTSHTGSVTKMSLFLILISLPVISMTGSDTSSARTTEEKIPKSADYSSDYIAVTYGMDDGLASSEINTILQSSDGYIWAGAYSGLYMYNGSKFKLIGLDERINNAIDLYEDSDGRIWVGTNDSGVFCYTHRTESMELYSTKQGLPSDSIRSICEGDDGSMYISTSSNLCKIDKSGKITVYNDMKDITCAYSLHNIGDDHIAGVTQDGVLFIIKNDRLITTEVFHNRDVSYTCIASDNNGNIIAGTTSGIFEKLYFDGEKLEEKSFINDHELSSCNAILYDKNQGGYFVATDSGLGYESSDNKIFNLTVDGFSNAISDVLIDYQNNIWFSSSKQGLLKLSLNPFADIFKKAELKQDVVNATLLSGNILYVGTDDGMYAVNTENYKKIEDTRLDIFKNERIRNLMKDDSGNIWVSTYGEHCLACIPVSGDIVLYNDEPGLLGSRFRFTMELNNGEIFAASSDGINFIKNNKIISTLSEDDGLTMPYILTAAELSDGSILAGSDGDGIYIIKDKKLTGHIGNSEGLMTLIVLRIIPYKDGFFYVTSNGLYYDNGSHSDVKKLSNFPYSNNYDIYISDDNTAWIMGSAGIYLADADDIINDGEYSYMLLNHTWGFNTTLTANAWNTVKNEDLYLCCTDGIRRINLNTFNKFNNNYNIIIDSFTDNGDDIAISDNVYQIPAGNGDIVLQPAVLNYTISNPLINVYIEGLDSPETRQHQLELTEHFYSNIPYGDYTLHIQVLDEHNGTILKQAAFPIHKDSKLYEHFYFRLYVLFIIVLFVGFLAWMVAEMQSMAVINRQYDQIREAKEEAEFANQAKSRFLANMSHEIRTPINTVLGMDEMILRESSDKEIRGYASDIFTAGNTLLSLINDILDSSKIESGKMEIVPVEYELPVVIRDLVNMISQKAASKNLELEVIVEEDLPTKLYGDDVRIKQVVTNILTNAVKYTHEGTVWLRVSGTASGENELLHIEVEDTGIGIKEEDLPKLFMEYQRIEEGRNRNIEGTGLGMNITLQLLKLMGSKLNVESVYGEGSKFWFDIDQKIIDDTPVGSFKELLEKAADSYSYNGGFYAPDADILVVDDNSMNRKVFKSLLKLTGMNIIEAGSGIEALDIVKNQKFDIIFTDHMMPDMDGVETMQHMREMENCKDVPIYVLTANAVTGAREQYLEAGFDGFLTKPIVSSKLEQIIVDELPPEKVGPVPEDIAEKIKARRSSSSSNNDEQQDNISLDDLPVVDGLDWSYANLHLPDEELLSSTIKEFHEMIAIHTGKLQEMYDAVTAAGEDNSEALDAYRIKVHAMKSVAGTIGIVPLAGMAKILEYAAKSGDTDTIRSMHDIFIKEWLSYATKLDGVFGISAELNEDPSDKEQADPDMLNALFDMLLSAMEDFDIDTVDELTDRLKSFGYSHAVEELMPELISSIKEMDTDAAEEVISKMRAIYN